MRKGLEHEERLRELAKLRLEKRRCGGDLFTLYSSTGGCSQVGVSVPGKQMTE